MRRHPSCGSLDLSPRNKGTTGQNSKKTAALQAKKRSRASDAPGANGSNGRSIAERGLKQSLRRGDPTAGLCSLQPKQSAFQKGRVSRTTGRIRRLRRSKEGSIASGAADAPGIVTCVFFAIRALRRKESLRTSRRGFQIQGVLQGGRAPGKSAAPAFEQTIDQKMIGS